jgi:hypothetical protein
MTALSPLMAASEGLRLMRREPKALAAWIVLWLAWFSAAAWSVAAGKRVVLAPLGGNPGVSQMAGRFGPATAIISVLFLLVWIVTVVAVYRAVLHPEQRRGFYLRLGWDEGRLGVLTVVASLILVLCGSAPGYLLFVLASPIMNAIPTATMEIAVVGVLATVGVECWLGVRLSLIAVETFSERRFHLSAYWPVTGGRFWYLLACYLLTFCMLFCVTAVFAAAGEAVLETGLQVGGGDIARRGSVLALAGVLAGLVAIGWTMVLVLICACQAYAFRAIVGDGRDGVAPA